MTFQEKVYFLVKKIPAGRVATYGQIARKLGNHKLSRAVGTALAGNLLGNFVVSNNKGKAIPCHRVVGFDGRLGGFNQGIRKKALLLEKEGIKIKRGKVDLKKYQYKF